MNLREDAEPRLGAYMIELDSLSDVIENLSARIVAIRDSL